MTLAVWLALLPLRLLAALGLRRSLILACLFVLAVTAIGVAEDLGLLDPPAAARYLCAAGAPRRLYRALYAYNHAWAYVAKVKAIAARYRARGGGRR
jgi:hypothetical protein